ncbi:MAG: TPM domain-containing protein [Saprospiraceae bacterium]
MNTRTQIFMIARYFFALLLISVSTFAFAKDIPPVPNPPRLVNDFAGMLSPQEEQALERKLVTYDDSTSTQIAVVTERTLEGEEIFDYTNRLARSWGIGREGKDNGILVYIALDDRKIFIQVGRGAEGFLPDAIAKRIIENIIKPAFRDQNYYAGIDRATDAIISYGSGEYTNEEEVSEEDLIIGFIILGIIVLIFIFIIVAIVRAAKRRNNDDDDDGGFYRGGRYNERGGGGWIFFPPIGGGGGWNSGGGSGGGGFGGFGGFGGGDFGGGGAGGDW